MQIDVRSRLTPSLLGRANATLRSALAGLAEPALCAQERATLRNLVREALRVMAYEPLPTEIAKGLVAYLACQQRSAADPEVARALSGTIAEIKSASGEIIPGSRFV